MPWRAEDSVTRLPWVGAERAALFERLGILALGDLLLHRPRRYEDRRTHKAIASLRAQESAVVRGRVVAKGVKYFQRRTRSVFEVILEDGTGRLHARWWNQPYLEDQFEVGMDLVAYGKVTELKPRAMDHPETEILEEGAEEAMIHVDRIVPIYPLTEGMGQRWLRAKVWSVVQALADAEPEPHGGLSRDGFCTRAEALRWLHFPGETGQEEVARQRLAFDEFVELQMEIQGRRRRLYANAPGWVCRGDNRLIRPLLKGLGFTLTEGQKRVLREIRQDLESGRPMRRLLQGDVGCGKTVVAAMAALMVVEGGRSVALMAPTEVLAYQHWLRFREWFGPLEVNVDLRTGSVRRGDTEESGSRPGLVVGTHALVASGYVPEDLGLVIIDEQHKFGVQQREALVRKGRYPHLLVMTATPIPRTMALTVYGDLEVSVIEQLPGGRGRIRTFVRGREAMPKVLGFVKEQLREGRQAYVVCAQVEGDEAGEVRAVTREWAGLKAALHPHEVGLLHGRLPAETKERVVHEFRSGGLAVLLATLVIEVGVDVPNASVMVIENAERFGLAQLHQLRGRIGRGRHEGYCILVTGKTTEESAHRMKVLEEHTDGFAIAEADLAMRGAGDLLGAAQSGRPPLRFGDLVRDRAVLEAARERVRIWEGWGAAKDEAARVG
ncbi:MAG: ATP-dependent DNA helicase RecG [Verrucomicrobiales bacterium]|nr:ATP-dependent DNA helicase RecG [Verrucomicrobiales bacterium]